MYPLKKTKSCPVKGDFVFEFVNPRFKKRLLFAQDLKHLGAADRTDASHSAALNATLALHGNFFGVFHLSLRLAFYAIGFVHICSLAYYLKENKPR